MALTNSTLYLVSILNGMSVVLIILLSLNFVYNVFLHQRISGAAIASIKINNATHFKLASYVQLTIFTLAIVSCFICTFFLPDSFMPAISPSLCTSLYSLSYCCCFIAQYLCLLMYLFRLSNITKTFSPRAQTMLKALFVIATLLHIAILIVYFDVSAPALITDPSQQISLCADDTFWLHRDADTATDLLYVLLNALNILLIIAIWMMHIYTVYFVKHHHISSIFASSYQSLSTSHHSQISAQDRCEAADHEKQALNQESIGLSTYNRQRMHAPQPSSSASSASSNADVVSSAVAATLQNSEVTIGANRRKRNYASNTSPRRPPVAAPEEEQKYPPADIGKLAAMSDQLQARRPRQRGRASANNAVMDECTNITVEVKKKSEAETQGRDLVYMEELRFVAEKQCVLMAVFLAAIIVGIVCVQMASASMQSVWVLYWNAISAFVNCLCSCLLFNYHNDVWYDVMQCVECYCCYDCCWRYCDCFIWHEEKNCYTFCCKMCVKQKVCDSDQDEHEQEQSNEQDMNAQDVQRDSGDIENVNGSEAKSIYARGSLRRLRQK